MKAHLNFRFDHFSEHLTETLLNLFSSKRLCDVRLIGDDGVPVMGHRVILAAFSTALNNVIEKTGAPTLDIRIQGMNCHDLERIIQFIYLGEVSVSHAGVDKFLRTAKFLGVSQLSDQCKTDILDLNEDFSVDENVEKNEETVLEETPKGQGTFGDYNDKSDIVINHEESNAENLDEYGIRIGEDHEEVNLKEGINDEIKEYETCVNENDFEEKDPEISDTYQTQIKHNQQLRRKGCEKEVADISEISDDFIIGEPAHDFNIFSAFFTHTISTEKFVGRMGLIEHFALCVGRKIKLKHF